MNKKKMIILDKAGIVQTSITIFRNKQILVTTMKNLDTPLKRLNILQIQFNKQLQLDQPKTILCHPLNLWSAVRKE